jgi:DNA invertase Pin-like site-specific DNA recombinase
MLVGYALIGLKEPNAHAQVDALKRAGCVRIAIEEGVPVHAQRRPVLDQLLAELERDDVLVVCSLGRLRGGLPDLVRFLLSLSQRDIGFRSLSESLDSAPENKASLYELVEAFAAFERDRINECTQMGLTEARRRGVRVGRKPKLSADQISEAQRLIDAGESADDVARTLGVSRATLYRALPAPMTNRRTDDLFASISS